MFKIQHRLRRRCLCALCAAVLFLVLLEGLARIYAECFRNRAIIVDSRLGWRSRPNHKFNGRYLDAAGRAYTADLRTDAGGFRAFGDLAAERPKLLFIGDSFTHAVEVSSEKTYYSRLPDLVAAEVFAYGALGYGTLQEQMILDEWYDRIRPDIVVVQFCANDFINNSLELEQGSCLNNNHMRRPYMQANGGIVYAMPARLSWLREFANKYSRLLYFVISRMDMKIAAARQSRSVERTIESQGLSCPEFSRSARVTGQLFELIARRAKGAIVLAFDVSDAEPYHGVFRQILERAGVREIPGVPEALRRAEARGLVVRARDRSHWNNEGHRVVAEVLAAYLKTVARVTPANSK